MSKLKAEKGAIYSVSETNLADGAINVIFRRKALNPNGDEALLAGLGDGAYLPASRISCE